MSETCSECGAKTVEYKHTLSKGLVRALDMLSGAGGGPININRLGFTHSQAANFQKLRYWGLVAMVYDEKGDRLAGVWQITPAGILFLGEVTKQHRSVWTYRSNVVRFEGPLVDMRDVDPEYRQREDYAAEAVAHFA